MHALIVYCHPKPRSFNGTLKDVAVKTLQRIGYTVENSDLYAENFMWKRRWPLQGGRTGMIPAA